MAKCTATRCRTCGAETVHDTPETHKCPSCKKETVPQRHGERYACLTPDCQIDAIASDRLVKGRKDAIAARKAEEAAAEAERKEAEGKVVPGA